MAKRPNVDFGFLQRTYRTTSIVGGMVTLILCSTANAKWVFNYAFGVLTMLAFVKTTEVFVTQTYRSPGEPKTKQRWVGALMLGKWVILTVSLYFLNKARYFDGVLLLAGLATMQAVIVFKVFGLMLQSLIQERP
ncbi:MAG: hypothetical protein ACUVTP_05040 [Candidatus Fervidibacter sp.]|uniref:hypothetical protein n=1 Tax=Candidatus Fervidibacter sp. TaxID=3100871 RepID=UPI00404940BA